jgi:hypothetical protein
MRHLFLCCLVALSLLTACNKEDMMRKFTPQQEDQTARGYISQIQQGKYEDIENTIDPTLKTASLHNILIQMSAQFPSMQPRSIKVVGAETTVMNDIKTVNLTYEFEFPSKWLLINIATKAQNGKSSIIGLNAIPMTNSMEYSNRFTFSDKKPQHYILFSMTILACLFSLLTLIVCIRTQSLKKKWLWIIGILVGVGAVNLNWTTGAMSLNIIHFQLLSSGMTSAPYGPCILSVSLPLFSILFWVKRKDLINQSKTQSRPINSEMAVPS